LAGLLLPGCDNHRHVLQVLLALLGGDDDAVDGWDFGILGGGLGLSRQRGQTGEHDGGRRAAKHLSKAHFLPRFVLWLERLHRPSLLIWS